MDTTAIDRDLVTLRDNADRWAQMPLDIRLSYLESIIAGTHATAEAQVVAAAAAKGIPEDSPLVGEEWLAGPVIQIRTARLLMESLRQIQMTGQPTLPEDAIHSRPDGQVVVQVFPNGTVDKLTFMGFEAEIWMQPEVTEATLPDNIAAFYRNPPPPGRVALVLGAGNVASIGPLDVIQKLFVEGQVCLLKYNPVNAYLGPFTEAAFGKLIEDGFLRTVYGGAEVGAYCCQHDGIDEIHVTGSDKTHDAIVYGVGEEGARRKANDEPQNTKRLTSELGNVSPVIVVPGSWTQADLRFHAENVATQMTNNGGFNCNAAKVLILHESWPQRRAFMDMLRAVLASAPQRKAYYPGAQDRYQRFVDAHPQSEPIGPRSADVLPWTIIPDVDPSDRTNPCFTEESFCGIMAQTSLGGSDTASYLRNAVEFCNDTLWGTLSSCIIIDPRTASSLGAVLDQAIADLRYGTVMINHWAALSYAMGCTAWGAFPGHTRRDIQSGVGAVHNTFLFDKPQKTVIRGPFRVWPRPPWFVTNKATDRIARAMLTLELRPSLWNLPRVILSALRG